MKHPIPAKNINWMSQLTYRATSIVTTAGGFPKGDLATAAVQPPQRGRLQRRLHLHPRLPAASHGDKPPPPQPLPHSSRRTHAHTHARRHACTACGHNVDTNVPTISPLAQEPLMHCSVFVTHSGSDTLPGNDRVPLHIQCLSLGATYSER